jgi:hypothetical protein
MHVLLAMFACFVIKVATTLWYTRSKTELPCDPTRHFILVNLVGLPARTAIVFSALCYTLLNCAISCLFCSRSATLYAHSFLPAIPSQSSGPSTICFSIARTSQARLLQPETELTREHSIDWLELTFAPVQGITFLSFCLLVFLP